MKFLTQERALHWFSQQSGAGALCYKYFGHYHYLRLTSTEKIEIYLKEKLNFESVAAYMNYQSIQETISTYKSDKAKVDRVVKDLEILVDLNWISKSDLKEIELKNASRNKRIDNLIEIEEFRLNSIDASLVNDI